MEASALTRETLMQDTVIPSIIEYITAFIHLKGVGDLDRGLALDALGFVTARMPRPGQAAAPQEVMEQKTPTSASAKEPRVRKRNRAASDHYVPGLMPIVRKFMLKTPFDHKIGLGEEWVRQEMFNQGLIPHTISTANIHRVLVANPRCFSRLPDGSWFPRPILAKQEDD